MYGSLVLALVAGGDDQVTYRYVPVPRVRPGSTLYTYAEGQPVVGIATDLSANLEFQKSFNAGDQKGIDELRDNGRLLIVPPGTAVKIREYYDGALTYLPSYEVRVLDGKYKDKKGWVMVPWVRARVKVLEKFKRKDR
jgi:hypothetical protein